MIKEEDFFSGVNCLITGGLGFIGSTLAIKLVQAGANVTLVDAMIPEYGGNLFNIKPVEDEVTINFSDVCDQHAMNWIVRDQDYVFHLAGLGSHVLSMTNPHPDIEINIKGTLVVMEALRYFNPGAKLVYTGTRGQYGSAVMLPVNESAPMNPKGIYEISNLTAEKIILAYHNMYGIRSVLLRLTNTYGPRAQMKHSHYGVANWFVRLALDNNTIPIFGDGKVLRDFLYVDDCVGAILEAVVCEPAYGDVFNIGMGKPTGILELAELIIEVSGTGCWQFAPYTPERKLQEPGDFYSDVSKISEVIGWQPSTHLRKGLKITVDYYREHRKHYW